MTTKRESAIRWAMAWVRSEVFSDKTDEEKIDAVATVIDDLRQSNDGMESVGTAFEDRK